MKTVPLHGKIAAGRVALVDDDDYDLVNQYRWHAWLIRRPDRRDNGPYASAYVRGSGKTSQVSIFMHRLITGWPQTDHVNRDGLDNRRANLRPASGSQNSANRRPQNGRSSSFKGVSWHIACRKWRAAITLNGTKHHLGCFATEADAAAAYDMAALAAWGEYAYLNFPLKGMNS